MIVLITAIMQEVEEDRSYIKPVSRLLIVAASVLLIVPFFGRYLNTVALLGIVALMLFVPVFIGVRSWVKFKFFGNQ